MKQTKYLLDLKVRNLVKILLRQRPQFIYFSCLTPIITFGGLLGDATENRIAAIESLMSGLSASFDKLDQGIL
jgi:HCO3- transporter family